MIGLAALLFVAAGIGGLASELHYGSYAYAINLPLRLLLYLLWTAIGIGLWRRREPARVLALGIYLAGSFAVPILIVYVWLNREALGYALGFAMYIALHLHQRYPNLLAAIPIAVGLFILLTIIGSIVSWLFYRYFRRPEVAEQFDAASTPAAAVWGIALVYVALLPFYSAGPTIRQDQLPGFAQSKAYKDSRKARAAQNLQERAQFLATLAGEVRFSADGSSIVVATDAHPPELFFLDAAGGAPARKDPSLYRVEAGTSEPDSLGALLSPDHRFFLAKNAKQLVETRSDQARAVSLPEGWLVALGFTQDAAGYLYFAPGSGKLEALDLAGNRVLFALDATRPDWLTNDFEKQELRRALRTGAWSPSRGHFAYVYRGRLHLLALPEGRLEIDERAMPNGSQPSFAKEGAALILTVNGAIGQPPVPGIVYMLADKSMLPHAIRPPVYYFSLAEERILSYGVEHVAEHSLRDLETPRRKLPLPQHAPYAVTADGRYLVVKARDKPSAEFADLLASATELPSFAPLQTRLASGQSFVRFATGPGRLLVVAGPRVELIGPEAFGGAGGAAPLHDLGTLSKDSRLAVKKP